MAEIPFQNKSDAPVFVIPAEALREELEELECLRTEVDGLRAMRDRAQAIARSGSSESARATAAVILSAVTE